MSNPIPIKGEKNRAFWSWDIAADTLKAGKQFADFFGCTTDKLPVGLDEASSFFLEQDMEAINEALESCFKSRGNEAFRCITKHLDEEKKLEYNLTWRGEVTEWSDKGKPLFMTGSVEQRPKKHTQKLPQSTKALLFERLMDHLPIHIFFKDMDGRFIVINDACAERFRLDSPSEAIGKTDFDIFDEEHAREAYEDEKEILKTQEAIIDKVEREGFHGEDSELWVSTTKVPLYNEEGALIGTFGISRDITEQRKLEEELKKRIKHFEMLSGGAPGFLFLYQQHPNGKVTFPFASAGIQELFGLSPEELRKDVTSLVRRVHEEDIQRVNKSIQESVKNLSKWDCEFRIILPEKGMRWIKGKANPEKQEDGSVISSGYLTDITQEKKITKSNIRLREQFQAVINSAPNLIFIKNQDGQYLLTNKSAAAFYGYDQDEMIGKTDTDLGVPEEKVEMFLEMERKVIENNEPAFIPEDKSMGPDGSAIWHQTIKVPFLNTESGKPAVLSIVTDITDRKQNELELSESLDIIGEQNKRLTNFAHIVSHNLRNHAGNISMLLSLYSMEDSEDEREELMQYLHSASERLNESIHDLNEVIDQQYKKTDKRKEVRIDSYVSKIKEILTTEILSNNVKVKEEISENMEINYNPAYLESIILNLLSNAIKYRHPDRQPVIHVKAYMENEHAFLEVSDNGLGIDLEKYGDKLFGMYSTFHQNKNSKGIGLFITKNQIESMGGSVEVESEEGKGTTFKVKLL